MTVFFLFLITMLAADQTDVTADNFYYDGKEAHLNGHVILNHPFGEVKAQKADLILDPKKEKGPFSKIFLEGEVSLDKPPFRSLKCDKGEIDCIQEKGHFESLTRVVFEQKIKETPFIFSSKKLDVDFAGEKEVKSLVGEDEILFTYGDIKGKGGLAQAVKISPEKKEYLLKLVPKPGFPAQIEWKDRYLITANAFEINTEEQLLTATSPKGHVAGQEIDFEADRMTWDEKEGILKLSGKVLMVLKGKGTLVTDKQVVLKRDSSKKWVEALAQGPVVFSRVDEDKNKGFYLTAYGDCSVDLIHHVMTLRSPSEPSFDRQVHFKDKFGECFGDTFILTYKEINKELKIDKLFIHGQVYLSYVLSSELERSYALADKVTYSPQNFEMILESKPPSRVLLFDKINKVEVSAPLIKMKRDQATHKETIQGEGDVRFNLAEKEFQDLKKRFKFNEEESP